MRRLYARGRERELIVNDFFSCVYIIYKNKQIQIELIDINHYWYNTVGHKQKMEKAN